MCMGDRAGMVPPATSMPVDGGTVDFPPGDTILSASQRVGIHIPTLCHLDGFSPTGSCRFCVVEVAGRPALVPSCTYPAESGLDIQTHSARVIEARRTIIGLLLADHPGDCLACVRSGNCRLQELAAELDVRQRRSYTARPHHELDTSSPSITRETSKCVLCGKCVRVCEEVQGVAAIGFIGRGAETIVGPVFNQGMNVSSCCTRGQCTLACPAATLLSPRFSSAAAYLCTGKSGLRAMAFVRKQVLHHVVHNRQVWFHTEHVLGKLQLFHFLALHVEY